MITGKRHTRVLGIAVGERSMLIAEVHAAPQPKVVKTADFRFPEGVGLADSKALGEALDRFLKGQGFGSRTGVFGIPAKWVLSKRKEVPAADEQLVAETLRIQAEGEFSPELTDLVYDYSGRPSSAGAGSVLLLGLPRRYVDQISQVASQAGIRVQAVTPFAAALAAATVRPSQDAMVLLVGPGGIEFTAQSGGHSRALRYVGAPTTPTPRLAGELRRAAAPVSQNGQAIADNQSAVHQLTVWNGNGDGESSLGSLGESLGMPVRTGSMSDLGVDASSASAANFAPAVALALAGIAQEPVPIDFAHSRLAPPVVRRFDRQTILAAVTVAVLVLGLGAWFYSLHSEQADLDAQQAQLKAREPQRKMAKAVVSRIQFASAWHAGNPKYLACLRDLTIAGVDPGQLYGISLDLQEDAKTPGQMRGRFSGKAVNPDAVLKLRDHLSQAGRFSDVTTSLMEQRDSGKNGKEIGFTLVFNYRPPR